MIIANLKLCVGEMEMEKENTSNCNEFIDCNDPKCFKLERKVNGKICLGCVCE